MDHTSIPLPDSPPPTPETSETTRATRPSLSSTHATVDSDTLDRWAYNATPFDGMRTIRDCESHLPPILSIYPPPTRHQDSDHDDVDSNHPTFSEVSFAASTDTNPAATHPHVLARTNLHDLGDGQREQAPPTRTLTRWLHKIKTIGARPAPRTSTSPGPSLTPQLLRTTLHPALQTWHATNFPPHSPLARGRHLTIRGTADEDVTWYTIIGIFAEFKDHCGVWADTDTPGAPPRIALILPSDCYRRSFREGIARLTQSPKLAIDTLPFTHNTPSTSD
ncbi:hypothetical protein BDW22DRAFT_1428832 [Trametopsis cervina]|nr:hypothetical protein BDW22DRAFT_1428832 [Trametopsis cervina]